jgi:glycerophosphoryl diester phosphodiesterase
MRWIGLAVCAAAVAGCAGMRPGAGPGEMDIIAHRGASAYAPENTLAAFDLAADMKAHWFELDCTLSRDGEVVVIHDDSLDRTTGVKARIADKDAAFILNQEAGSWFAPEFANERVPHLRDALELAQRRGIGVYVEIKNSDDDRALHSELLEMGAGDGPLLPGRADEVIARIEASGSRNLELARRTIADIRALGMQKRVVIQSFSPVICAVALIEAKDIRTELLANSSDGDPNRWPQYLEFERLLQPAGLNVNHRDATPELVNDLHARGRSVAVWTVNDPADMARLRRMGVDRLITDKPDLAREVLGQQ